MVPDASVSRVAVFYHYYPHYRKGVIERLMAEPSLEVTFFGGAHGKEGINTYEFASGSRFTKVWTLFLGRFVLQPGIIWRCLLGRFDCFVFLADPNHLTSWIAAAACRLRGRRVIFWGHGFKSSTRTKRNLLRKAFFVLAHGFYTYGYRAKQAAIDLGFAPSTIYVGFNSLDYNHQLILRNALIEEKRAASGGECLRIVCISRLTRACRYEQLFEALSMAKRKGLENFTVLVIGAGPERAALERSAKVHGVDATFLGAIYDEHVIASHLYDADVTVSPGKVGLTAMHSLMYGTPVISHDDFLEQMPEVEALVPGVTGELFGKGDVEALSERLLNFRAAFPDRAKTRLRCFQMMDEIYNPRLQVEVMRKAVMGVEALTGNDVSVRFGGSAS
jgi:glycosyltransferase involved in cell wall biosynthesis